MSQGRKSLPIRVPAGTRHAFRNYSEAPAEMLVGLVPGGMEELFYKYRTDVREFDLTGFVQEAKQLHGTASRESTRVEIVQWGEPVS